MRLTIRYKTVSGHEMSSDSFDYKFKTSSSDLKFLNASSLDGKKCKDVVIGIENSKASIGEFFKISSSLIDVFNLYYSCLNVPENAYIIKDWN